MPELPTYAILTLGYVVPYHARLPYIERGA
jgi:hypothetical protein